MGSWFLSVIFQKVLLMFKGKEYIAFLAFACLAGPTFGQLENAAYFSPGVCFSPEAKKSFYTKNYYEFAKLYNAPTREKAVENFRNLLKNAKTDEAKAWALFGLRNLGEPGTPKKLENIRLFTGSIDCRKVGNVFLNADGNIQIPEKYADIDAGDFILPDELDSYAKNVLCQSGMYATGAISGAGIIPAEVWALNILASGKSNSEISDTAREIWERSKNIEGRLYALLLFKRAGNESEFAKYLSKLNPHEKVTHMGGCIVMHFTMGELKDVDMLFNVKYAFNNSRIRPQCVNPLDKNLNLIAMRKIDIVLRDAEVKEDDLGYLPMRFRSKGAEFLCGEGLQKLAMQWLGTDSASQKASLENILNKHLTPNAPKRFIAHYSVYGQAVFVQKGESGYFLVEDNPKLGDEPCFDPLYYSTEIRKLEKRVMAGIVKTMLCGDKPNEDISLGYAFDRANTVTMECMKRDGLYGTNVAEKLAGKTQDGDILGEFIVLSQSGGNVSVWLCPIFKGTPSGRIELLKEQHRRYLSAIGADEKEAYNSLAKRHKTILDCP